MLQKIVGALTLVALFVATPSANASSIDRHVVRIDVVDIVAGRPPTSHHYDLVVESDGALSTKHFGATTIGARFTERQSGKPTLTLSIDRLGPTPLHMGGKFRTKLGVPGVRFGSGSKGGLTEVLVTVL